MTIFTRQIANEMKYTSFSILIMYYSCIPLPLPEQRIIVVSCSANIRLRSCCKQNKEIKWHATGKLIKFLFKIKENKAITQIMKSREMVQWN